MYLDNCPKINSFKWNSIEIDGVFYRDVKIFPDRVEKWDWAYEHHDLGIKKHDVQELLDNNCSLIILSQGMHRRLDTDFETYKLLLKADVDFFVSDTISAIHRYQEAIYDGYLVGALIHLRD